MSITCLHTNWLCPPVSLVRLSKPQRAASREEEQEGRDKKQRKRKEKRGENKEQEQRITSRKEDNMSLKPGVTYCRSNTYSSNQEGGCAFTRILIERQ